MRISIESPTPILVKKHYNSVHLSSLLVSCSAYGNGTAEERFLILKSTKQLLIRKIHYLATNIGKYRGKIENIVLGCTHYPLIQKEIGQVLGENVKFFNGAGRLAVHLRKILEQQNLLNNNPKEGKIEFIDSAENKEKREKKEKRFNKFLEEF